MSMERTLFIIKPDATSQNKIGAILSQAESQGLAIIAASMMRMDRERAEGFFAEYRAQPFFGDLVKFMTSGPIMVCVLEGKDAVRATQSLMGAANPKEASPGTLRADYGSTLAANAVHGSDSAAAAEREIKFFFAEL
ncbi:nucleoside-diphosphate kinase [Streptomyces sp. NPDC048442]|uniref:nucleoside-diphosphate kinase n=1 Tax=Streptomyces sp. NPDC048442 TaxID=3154823 RepID=UPI0034354AD4